MIRFDHEKLDVYKDALDFVVWCDRLLSKDLGRTSVRDQLDRASTSIVLNIAEGNGKRSGRDRARYFRTALGSSFECAACLDILIVKNRITEPEGDEGKEVLRRIAARLVRLAQVNLDRLNEEEVEYGRTQD